MACVYLLYSVSLNRYYTGSCNNLQTRLEQHKNREYANAYTRRANDWILYLSIERLEYQQARKIEKHIKSMKNHKYYLDLKKYPEIVEKLRTRYR